MSFGTKEFWDTWYKNLLTNKNHVGNVDSKSKNNEEIKNGGIVEWYIRYEQLKSILDIVKIELSKKYDMYYFFILFYFYSCLFCLYFCL